MQPTQSSMLFRTAGGTSPRQTTSDTANRPPGLSTRNASASTFRLSADRLMTQLEMITSTEASGSGMLSISPLRNSTFSSAGLALVLARERQHLVGHVEPVRLAGRADPPGGEQHVDAAAGAQVEHHLTLAQLGERRRIAAPQGRKHRLGGKDRRLRLAVQVGRDRVVAGGPTRPAAAAACPGPGGRLAARPFRTAPGPWLSDSRCSSLPSSRMIDVCAEKGATNSSRSAAPRGTGRSPCSPRARLLRPARQCSGCNTSSDHPAGP